MSLENMLEGFEDKVEYIVDSTGFVGKILYGKEIDDLKGAIDKSRHMRTNMTHSQEWYTQYGQMITNIANMTHEAIEKTYTLSEFVNPIYEFVKKIPIIGSFLQTKEEGLRKEIGIKRYPSKEALHYIVEQNYKAALSTLSVIGEANTDYDYKSYLDAISIGYKNKRLEENTTKKQPYLGGIWQNIKSVFQDIIKPQPTRYAT